MKKLAVIYASFHHDNTINLIKAALDNKECDFFNVLSEDFEKMNLNNYQSLIIGSGIYHGKVKEELITFINSNKNALKTKKILFVITSGISPKLYSKKIGSDLKKVGILNATLFATKGFDTYGLWGKLGGLNKNKPNQKAINQLKEIISNFI